MGFGPDITCCGGDCQPLTMKDIRKVTQGDNDNDSFMQWARMLGKLTSKDQIEIPPIAERQKIR